MRMFETGLLGVLVIAAMAAPIGASAAPKRWYDWKSGDNAGDVCTNRRDGAEMVWVPAGEFIMGSTDAEISDALKSAPGASAGAFADETPQRKVSLDGYWIYRDKVTVGQYRKFCRATKRRMPVLPKWVDGDAHPMIYVTWQDAAAYAHWAGVCLPTEAQWEKAARGTDGRLYPWGNQWPAPSGPDGKNSPFGCRDMTGKFLEWCDDWYQADYYKTAPNKDPIGPLPQTDSLLDSTRVMRGTPWRGESRFSRCANRSDYGNFGSVGPSYVGFRCVGKQNRLSGYTFIHNQDCMDVSAFSPPGKAQEWQRKVYHRAYATGARVFVAQIANPDIVQTKDTPTGEIWGERHGMVHEGKPAGDANSGGPVNPMGWYQGIYELITQGTDTLHLACEEASKAGTLALAGVRMSDAHHGYRYEHSHDAPGRSKFSIDHPEWCNTWKDGTLDLTLNYAYPQVRSHRLQIIRELATNYDVDGVELDWMRWCRNFPEGTGRQHLQDLTVFVKEVREMLDEVSRKKGVPRMILGQRVPVTVGECLDIGCDVPTWIREGYADYVAPMDYLQSDPNVAVEEFVALARGTNCLVYPGFGSLRYSFGPAYSNPLLDSLARTTGMALGKPRKASMRVPDHFRAIAANYYAWGADGATCYNMYMWDPEQQEARKTFVAALSDPRTAKDGPRHYLYQPTWKSHNNGIGPTGRFNAQSLSFGTDSVGKRQVFKFRMADGRNGEQLHGVMRIRFFGATPSDKFAVDLNGVAVEVGSINSRHNPDGEVGWPRKPGDPTPDDGTFDWPANLCYEIDLQNCPPFRGDNELGITAVELGGGKTATSVTMEALEVLVR